MPDQNIEVMQRRKVFRDADKVHYNVKFNERAAAFVHDIVHLIRQRFQFRHIFECFVAN
jgi:hypothetical protein